MGVITFERCLHVNYHYLTAEIFYFLIFVCNNLKYDTVDL